MSNAVYLGKLNFNWCDNCNVPILGKRCDICGSEPRKVNVTPPGEFKFALNGDFELIDKAFENILNEKFSDIFKNRVVILNRIPGIDRTEEIIVNGYVIATIVNELDKIRVALRPSFYYMTKNHIKDIFIEADPVALDSIKKGNNLMAPGVVSVGKDVKKDQDVFIVDHEKNPVALGISRILPNENIDKGMAVKVKFIMERMEFSNAESNIEKTIKANKSFMEQREKQSIEKLKTLKDKKVFVSFSGGKDSLVALHLTIRSGINFKTLFLNTGLEFDETVDYVKRIVDKFSLDLDVINAGNAFFDHLNHFGPPGRDYRWCCKVCKLGPTTRYIKEHSEGPIYMIIGQRAYESKTRASKGEIWENEWVPNQIGVSPIQNWNSLMIWLYIFENHLDYNPWYDNGLWRTGCFLCPSQDLGDLIIVKSKFEKYSEWENFLKSYALKNGIDEVWIKYGLWRWNSLPENLKNRFNFNGFERTSLKIEKIENDGKYILKPNKKLNTERLKNMLNILPKSSFNINGEITVLKNLSKLAEQVIYESEECVGCGICTGRCAYNALFLKDGKVWVNEKKCIHCTKCLGPCPAYVFR